MDPKFQSSFIPKGPQASSTAGSLTVRNNNKKEHSFFSFVSLIIFIISVLLAVGMFGYKFYLKYSINKMGADLDQARATLQPEIISELTSFNNRIISTKELISNHLVLTPVFKFLEASAPKTVRFKDFRYVMTERGIELQMKGEAQGYAALALQADIFSKSEYFKSPIFSDLSLNDKGEVAFSFQTIIDKNLISYEREIKDMNLPSVSLPTNLVEDEVVSTSSPEVIQN